MPRQVVREKRGPGYVAENGCIAGGDVGHGLRINKDFIHVVVFLAFRAGKKPWPSAVMSTIFTQKFSVLVGKFNLLMAVLHYFHRPNKYNYHSINI